MLSVYLLFVTITVAVNGQVPIRDYRINPYYEDRPRPYSFSYNAPLDDGVGQSSRSETGDSFGRVQGSYSLNNDEGHFRVVDYVADENGFRASIRTNEPGTESKNPADVVIDSSAVPYYPFTPYRRPYLNPVAPVVAPVAPAVAPEAVVPVRPAVYRRPNLRMPVRPNFRPYRG